MAALLRASELRARYGWTRVLHGVSFEVEEGGITTILGANGAGKTTTLRAVSGLVSTEGSVHFAGGRIDGRAPEDLVRAGIAHVPEGRGTFVGLTVEENLRLGAYARRERARSDDFERVYQYFPILRERRRQVAGTLSGGEQQMLAIARALMLSPRLLLLDEPSLGLAPLVMREIFRIVRAINRDHGVSVLLVEQNAAIALAFVGGLLIERIVIRPVENAPVLAVVIVCIGLLVILNSVAGWIYSYIQKPFPSPFPGTPIRFGNVVFGAHDLGAIGITLVVLLFLYVFFRYTTLGLAMRAAAQNPVSSRLCGVRVGWMLAVGWGLAALVGAVAGMMVAPIVFLDPNMMAGILIYAFASATLGGFTSPGGAVVGGLLVGVIENLVGTYVRFIGTELKLTVALAIIIIVLVVKPSGLFGRVVVRRV